MNQKNIIISLLLIFSTPLLGQDYLTLDSQKGILSRLHQELTILQDIASETKHLQNEALLFDYQNFNSALELLKNSLKKDIKTIEDRERFGDIDK